MVRTNRRLSEAITVLLLVSVSVLLIAPIACNSSQDMIDASPLDSATNINSKLADSEGKGEPEPVDSSEKEKLELAGSEGKGNPKLDSLLDQLVRAETRGEAALFAEQSNIELVNNSVRVILECVPGQLEVATKAATDAGATLEASYDNLLQVVVPIARLSTLADATSIHFIRLPQQPLPAVS